MKINETQNKSTQFSSLYTNKAVLKGLEKIAEHPASFSVAASFIGAAALRPLVVSAVPKTNKENKKYFSANSISSGLIKLLTTLCVSLPVEKAIKNINNSPKDFLNQKTYKNFFKDKKSCNFLSQIIKQSTNFITAIPKSYLTVALTPILVNKIFSKKEENKIFNPQIFKGNKNFSDFNNISFEGKNKVLEKGISKIINNENIQNFSKSHSKNAKNITRNLTLLTDSTLTLASVFQIKNSKKIKEKRKKPMIINNVLSALLCELFGYSIDEIIQKNSKNMIEKFEKLNKNNPKLPKYIEGLNILRPTIIFGLIYYGIIPVVTSFLSDKSDKVSVFNKEKS